MSEEQNKKKKPVTMKDVQAKAEEKKCPVQQTIVFIEEFLAEPMCGRCFPCSFGSYEAEIRIRRISDGTGTEEDPNKAGLTSHHSTLTFTPHTKGRSLLHEMPPKGHRAASDRSR